MLAEEELRVLEALIQAEWDTKENEECMDSKTTLKKTLPDLSEYGLDKVLHVLEDKGVVSLIPNGKRLRIILYGDIAQREIKDTRKKLDQLDFRIMLKKPTKYVFKGKWKVVTKWRKP